MSSEVVSAAVSPLVVELFDSSPPRRAFSLLGWGVALGAHVLVASFALTEHRTPPRSPPPLEVELAPPAPPPPPSPPALLPTPPDPHLLEHALAPKAAAAPPEPAHVGALVTAKADPSPSPKADEPVDFTNDPGALGFRSGIVALGGKAEVGLARAERSLAPASGSGGLAPRPTGDSLTPVGDLSRKPGLGESDPCRGYFPGAASDDVASAAVMVTISKSGTVSNVALLSESPAGQGFGAAATTCMKSKRFTPGLDHDGNTAATRIRVNVHFER
jgi:protein TonB